MSSRATRAIAPASATSWLRCSVVTRRSSARGESSLPVRFGPARIGLARIRHAERRVLLRLHLLFAHGVAVRVGADRVELRLERAALRARHAHLERDVVHGWRE